MRIVKIESGEAIVGAPPHSTSVSRVSTAGLQGDVRRDLPVVYICAMQGTSSRPASAKAAPRASRTSIIQFCSPVVSR